MAVIRDTKVTQLTTEAANITVELPTHATDDLLLVFGAKDATFSGTLTTGTSGWTIGGQNSSTGSGGWWAYKVAASAAETNPNFTQADVDSMMGVGISIRGAYTKSTTQTISVVGLAFSGSAGSFLTDNFAPGQIITTTGFTAGGNNTTKTISTVTATTITVTDTTGLVNETGTGDELIAHQPINVSTGNGVNGTTGKPSIAGVTTTAANCIVFYAVAEATGVGPTPYPGLQRVLSDDTGTCGLGAGWMFKTTAGASGTFGFYGVVVDTIRTEFVVAVADGSGGTLIPPYHDTDTTMATIIDPLVGTVLPFGGSWTSTLSLATIGSKSTAGDAISALADSGVNPFHATSQISPAISATVLGGSQLNLVGATDLTGGILLCTFFFTAPRDYIDVGFVSSGGIQVVVADASNNYKSWMVGGQRSKTTSPDKRNFFAIQVDQATDTGYATSATPPTKTAITKFLFLEAPVIAIPLTCFNQMIKINKVVVAGGSTSFPLSFLDFLSVVNGYVLPFAIQQADGGALAYCPMQIGGSQAVMLDMQNFSVQFPRQASQSAGYLDFHVDDGVVGFIFDGRAGDIIKVRSALIQSVNKWKFEFLSTVSTSATWDFDGLTLIGAIPTLRNIGTSTTAGFQNMTFVDCDQIVQNSATLTGCTINGTLHATAALLSNNPAVIKNCTFTTTNDGDIGHSIQINTAGTYAFDGNIFTGGGPAAFGFHTQTDVDPSAETVTKSTHGYSDGDAIYYQDQGGSDTIGLTDGSLYYVNAVTADTLSFYDTKVNAIAGGSTGRANLSDGAAGQTHYIYSAKADVYNSTGSGTVTLNITGTDIPTIRNSDGSTTNVIQSVTVALTVVDEATDPVEGVQIYFQKSATGKTWNYTSAAGNSAGDVDFVVSETLDSDLPQTGWVHVWNASTNTKQNYRYTSWTASTKTFALKTEVTGSATSTDGTDPDIKLISSSSNFLTTNFEEGDTIRNTTTGAWAVIDEIVDATHITTTPLSSGVWTSGNTYSMHRLAIAYTASTDLVDVPIFNGQTNASGDISTTYNYSAYGVDLPVTIRVRSNTGATKYIPYTTSGTIYSTGSSGTVVLTQDTVAT